VTPFSSLGVMHAKTVTGMTVTDLALKYIYARNGSRPTSLDDKTIRSSILALA
jgi:hypothetical protein